MSDESDLDLDTEDDDNPTVKKIREAYKAIKKERDAFKKVADEVEKQKRAESVADALKAKGIDPDYAGFYGGEDTSPEAVNAWVEKNAKLVGYQPAESPEEQQRQDAAERISNATASAPPQSLSDHADLQHRLATAKTREELNAVYAELEKVRFRP